MTYSLRAKLIFVAGLTLAIMGFNVAQAADTCEAPIEFIAPLAPVPAPMEDLLNRSESLDVDMALQTLLAVLDDMPMEQQVDPDSPLPRVIGTQTLTEGDYGVVGSRRLVCLDDGSIMLEHVLDRETTKDKHVFRYQLWNYTSQTATALDYSVGEFVYTTLSPTSTQVTWTHGFSLKENEIPGALGRVGRWLFRKNFLESEYAQLMKGTLAHMKSTLETPAGSKTNAP